LSSLLPRGLQECQRIARQSPIDGIVRRPEKRFSGLAQAVLISTGRRFRRGVLGLLLQPFSTAS
jgi:hypothetical protein